MSGDSDAESNEEGGGEATPGSSSSDALLRAVARVDEADLRMPRVDLSGQTVGRYRLLRLLGAGGMGSVYAAEDEALGRVVALKLLHRERTHDPDRRRRFLREARSASAVKHANIAAVYDVGFAEADLFIAMELCEGVSLRRHIAGGPLSPAEVVRIGIEIAEGLAVAHERGIVHRDLKPDNVMIGPDGSVKVLDFSLAKLLAPSDPSIPRSLKPASTDELTVEGRILGTPSYMSPEQARGLSVDARSDVFALGVVLYEMATGVRPFKGRTAMETLIAVGTDTTISAHRRDRRVPLALSNVIGRCLEKDPDARWPGTREVASALRRSERLTVRLATPAAGAALAFACLALVGGAGFVAWTGQRVPAPPAARPSMAMTMTMPTPLAPPASPAPPETPEAAPLAGPSMSGTEIRPLVARAAAHPGLVTSASASAGTNTVTSTRVRPARDPLSEQK